MSRMTQEKKPVRVFAMHGTARLHALEGVPLATFGQRAAGYFIDVLLAVMVWAPLELAWRYYLLHETRIEMKWDFHEVGNLVVMLLYWAAFHYFANGRTPGKFVTGTRVMSLTSERMGLWQSVERALGYGAAILEAGLGFAQFFWDKNRMCAQDRLAETIVVDARKRTMDKDVRSEAEVTSPAW